MLSGLPTESLLAKWDRQCGSACTLHALRSWTSRGTPSSCLISMLMLPGAVPPLDSSFLLACHEALSLSIPTLIPTGGKVAWGNKQAIGVPPSKADQ